jgi:hypothetical protein
MAEFRGAPLDAKRDLTNSDCLQQVQRDKRLEGGGTVGHDFTCNRFRKFSEAYPCSLPGGQVRPPSHRSASDRILSGQGKDRRRESHDTGRFGGGVRADDLPCPGNGVLFMSFRYQPIRKSPERWGG